MALVLLTFLTKHKFMIIILLLNLQPQSVPLPHCIHQLLFWCCSDPCQSCLELIGLWHVQHKICWVDVLWNMIRVFHICFWEIWNSMSLCQPGDMEVALYIVMATPIDLDKWWFCDYSFLGVIGSPSSIVMLHGCLSNISACTRIVVYLCKHVIGFFDPISTLKPTFFASGVDHEVVPHSMSAATVVVRSLLWNSISRRFAYFSPSG